MTGYEPEAFKHMVDFMNDSYTSKYFLAFAIHKSNVMATTLV